MKRVLISVLMAVLMLPALAIGCKSGEPPAPSVPPLHGGQPAVTLEYIYNDFTSQSNIVKDETLIVPGSLIVTLFSNPTTGYKWSDAEISDPSVIQQESHNFVEPQAGTPVVGAGGKEVWVFNSLKAGTATVKLGYSQPWEGGTKNEWTLTLNIIVK